MTTPVPVTLEVCGDRRQRQVNADLMRANGHLSDRVKRLEAENARLRERFLALVYALSPRS